MARNAGLGGLRRMIAQRMGEPVWKVGLIGPDGALLPLSSDPRPLADVLEPLPEDTPMVCDTEAGDANRAAT
jgi:hypothetical protein